MPRSAVSAFTRVFDALWFAAWCAADPGPIEAQASVGPGSAAHRRRGAAPRPGHALLLHETPGRNPRQVPDRPVVDVGPGLAHRAIVKCHRQHLPDIQQPHCLSLGWRAAKEPSSSLLSLAGRDSIAGQHLSRRYGARMVPAHLQEWPYHPHKSVWHHLLLISRVARHARRRRTYHADPGFCVCFVRPCA